MADPERPSRVIPIDGVRQNGRSGSAPAPAEVARRLAQLEHEVEEALAAPDRQDAAGLVRSVLDEALGAYSDVRRWLAGEARAEASPLGELGRRLLFRLWWRVEVVGVERVPASGRVLVVVNRAGTLVPYAAFMVAEALEAPERAAVPCIDPALLRLPVLGPMLAGLGGRLATAREVRAILRTDDLAVVLPEGPGTVGKPWSLRYRLGAFTRVPLLRTAIETGAPIVPVAAIGSEETQPTLARLEVLGRPLGLPALPVTPTLVPLPTKWTLCVGEPLDVASRWPPAAAGDAQVLRALRVQVRERLQDLVSDGLRRRRGLFR